MKNDDQFECFGTVEAETNKEVPNCYFVNADPDARRSVLKWLFDRDGKRVKITFEILE